MSKFKFIISLATSALLFISCSEADHQHDEMNNGKANESAIVQTTETNIESALVILYPTEGSEANGQVTFTKMEDGRIKVNAEVYNLTPGKHGFHVHEFGDCSSPDGKSAGGHFFTDHDNHGALEDNMTHVGDLGNLNANADGIAKVSFITDKLSLSGMNNIIGRGVIVHEGEDDTKTQPTGGAGARVACGVIGISK
ncbi:MAG: superoxide dismutase family protein [Ignavibacteriae bacterium HGW-Ignavibacteriae-4]|jgi:Cu-Zn family superoxide dismutase|nr:MAG: superoxide dismutase family protein [Ignavibacteriae bacterium HGW-Ignavibacteriae-4]